MLQCNILAFNPLVTGSHRVVEFARTTIGSDIPQLSDIFPDH